MTERKSYLDALRVMAFGMVCAIHVFGMEFSLRPVDSLPWRAGNLMDGASRCCIPLFFMISGALLLDEKKRICWRSFFAKNVLRLITACLFWSALYTLWTAARYEDTLGNWVIYWLSGNDHLWFVYATLGIYALLPLLRPIGENPGLRRYAMLLTFLFGSLAPTLGQLFQAERFMGIVDKFGLSGLSAYLCCFLAGRELSGRELSGRGRWALWTGGLLSELGIVLGTRLLSLKAGYASELLYAYQTPMCLLAAAALFTLVRRWFTLAPPGPRWTSALESLSGLTFGAYLSHNLIKYALFDSGLWSGGVAFLLRGPGGFALVLGGGYLISFVMHRLPWVRSHLV